MFTILVPTFNRASLLKRCLTTILEQSFTKYEVFILDDNSSDETSNIVLEFTKDDRFKYIKFETNGGFLRNYRHVLSNNLNSYEWILLFSDDDGMGNTEYLRKCYECICKYPDIKLIAGEIVFDYDIFKLRSKRQELPEYFVVEDLSSLEFKLLTQKPSYNFHISTIKMFNLFGDNNGLTFEIPFEKICYQSAVGYVPEAEYLFAVHYQNRRNYLDLSKYFASVFNSIHKGYLSLDAMGYDFSKENFKERLQYFLNDESMFFNSIPNRFNINAMIDIVCDLYDKDNVCDAIFDISKFIEKYFQPIIYKEYSVFNSILNTNEDAIDSIDANDYFCIYGKNYWATQIRDQLLKKSKKVFCIFDDSGLDDLNNIQIEDSGQKLQIVISSTKPKSIQNMINNLKKSDIEFNPITLLMKDPYFEENKCYAFKQ